MHEMSIAESIVELIEEELQSHPYAPVIALTLQIGKLAAVEPEALQFCFEIVAENSRLHGAELIIEEIEAFGVCSHCKQTVPLCSRFDPCHFCNHAPVEPITGTEMKIKEIALG